MKDVYPLVAESSGVIMIHPRTGQTAAEYAAIIGLYPEITFLNKKRGRFGPSLLIL